MNININPVSDWGVLAVLRPRWRERLNGEVMCRKASSIITAMLQRVKHVKRQTLYTKKNGCQGATTQNARSATSYLLISQDDKKPQSGANFQTRRQ